MINDLKKIVDEMGTVEITVSNAGVWLKKIGSNWSLRVFETTIDAAIKNALNAMACQHDNAVISISQDIRFKDFDYTAKCPCGFYWYGSSKAKKRDETIRKIGMKIWKRKEN
jgi:hypothetical protein